jgi:DNA-binding response OmpR family regulator
MRNNITAQAAVTDSVPAHYWTNSLCRILLVDDDHDLRSFIAALLVRYGYHVDTAGDGASGWRALKNHRYDVLITDNTMPGVTGLELIKKLRSEDMTLAVIMASGTVPAEELMLNPWLNIDALLPKPYTFDKLVETVDEVLHKTITDRKAIADRTRSKSTAAKKRIWATVGKSQGL